MSELKERPLEDDYPCHPGFLYVVGERVVQNWLGVETVGELRRRVVEMDLAEPDVVIKNCDIVGRGLEERMI